LATEFDSREFKNQPASAKEMLMSAPQGCAAARSDESLIARACDEALV
jgi:hypothetical protein